MTSMTIRTLRLRSADVENRASFLAHVEAVFRAGSVFRRNADWDGWTPSYDVLGLADDRNRILSTVGRMTMTFVFDGAERAGYQLATVGTAPDWRGKGLAARLLHQALGEALGMPVILFANQGVVDFYPRFGFRRIRQWRFRAKLAVAPAQPLYRTLHLDDAAERTWLLRHCAAAQPVSPTFGARDYYAALLFNLCAKPRQVFVLDDVGAVVVTETTGDRLVVHDLLPTRPFDLASALPRLTETATSVVEFGFDPEAWWPSVEATPASPDDAPLFVNDAVATPTVPFRFPDLAHT